MIENYKQCVEKLEICACAKELQTTYMLDKKVANTTQRVTNNMHKKLQTTHKDLQTIGKEEM
jgi:hypothetical protein